VRPMDHHTAPRAKYNRIFTAEDAMDIIHIERAPDGGYMILDATSAGLMSASFAPASAVLSDADLRSALAARGVTQKAIDEAVRQVNEMGTTMITLP
jgi:hypothetical protein